jgi:C1A family cysteine protease
MNVPVEDNIIVTPHNHRLDVKVSVVDPKDWLASAPLLARPEPPPHGKIAGVDHAPVLDQLPLGSCTANAYTNAMGALMPEYMQLSRLMFYWCERNREGSVMFDSGAALKDGAEVARTIGCAPETDDPYNIADFRTPPTLKDYYDAQQHRIAAYWRQITTQDVRIAITNGHPVIIGFGVDPTFEEVGRDGVVPMPKPGEPFLGCHCTWIWGYDIDMTAPGGFTYHARNSWSLAWGDNGDFHVSDWWLADRRRVFDLFSIVGPVY